MAKIKFTVNYGTGVTVLPKRAADLILSGEASEAEARVLLAALSEGEALSAERIAEKARVSVNEVESAVAFWRGTGILKPEEPKETLPETEKSASPHPTDSAEKAALQGVSDDTLEAEASERNAPTSEASEKNAPASGESSSASKKNAPIPEKKALLTRDMPKYEGELLSALLEKDGGRLREMIDECQQLMGHIFNLHETSVMVGICDWLGVDSEYLIMLTAYYAPKKPKCTVHYIEKTALGLVNKGIETKEALESYISEEILYDGLAGRLRGWLGIGGRAFTAKENDLIKRWAVGYGFSEDVVKLAYDITVDKNLTFNFNYANRVLENWYKDGARSLEEVLKLEESFKNERKTEKEKDEAKKSSFDTDEFFMKAMKRSYESLGKNKKDT